MAVQELKHSSSASRQSKKEQTLTTSVMERLRNDIIKGRLLPAQRLRFGELKSTYGVGLSPLREALMRLVADGLVRVKDHRGFQVAPISKCDLIDINFMRKQLEGLAIGLSIERGDDRWESGIVAAFHELAKWENRRFDGGVITDEWNDRHAAFHYALVSGCGSPTLLRFRTSLYERAERYRSISLLTSNKPRAVLDEHRQIMEAVLERDKETAILLIQAHFNQTTKTLLAAGAQLFEDSAEEPDTVRTGAEEASKARETLGSLEN
jgi:DNA-binding GntR family transcriptional regulator